MMTFRSSRVIGRLGAAPAATAIVMRVSPFGSRHYSRI